MNDLRTYYAGYRLRLIMLEQARLEMRARHWIKGDHGYFAGSYSTGGGGKTSAKAVDKTGESGIINKKIRFYNLYEETENAYTEDEIEAEMQKSPIGQFVSNCVTEDGFSIEMNYDRNAPLYECGYIKGKDITVYTINHSNATEIAETIIHEVAHEKFNWSYNQEGEINCRIYEYLHSHKTISDNRIKEIVDEVREYYSYLPEGELYGY